MTIKYRFDSRELRALIEQVTVPPPGIVGFPFSAMHAYFDTWEEAHAELVNLTRKKFDAAAQELKDSRELLRRVENLAYPAAQAHRFPWPQAHSAYDNAGPAETVTFDLDGHTFIVAPTGDTGFDTGRNRYFVRCFTCAETLHENTTGPECMIDRHLETKRP